MLILDAQVHAWFSDRPSRPWAPEYRPAHRDKQSYLQHAGQSNSPAQVIEEMDEAGVDGALLTPLGVYGHDLSVELGAAQDHPDRFQVIGTVDHLSPTLEADLAAARERGLRGIRMIPMREPERVARNEFDRFLDACRELDLVVTLSLIHPLDTGLVSLLERNPDVFFYIDHLGLGVAPPILGFRPEEPFRHLPAVLELARLENVGIKLTGAPSVSLEEYPFRDIWEPIRSVVEAFGAERLSWGSDFSRTASLHSYADAVRYLAELPFLDAEELELIYSGTLIRRTGWDPAGAATH